MPAGCICCAVSRWRRCVSGGSHYQKRCTPSSSSARRRSSRCARPGIGRRTHQQVLPPATPSERLSSGLERSLSVRCATQRRRSPRRVVSHTIIAAKLGAFPVNIAAIILRTGVRQIADDPPAGDGDAAAKVARGRDEPSKARSKRHRCVWEAGASSLPDNFRARDRANRNAWELAEEAASAILLSGRRGGPRTAFGGGER